MSAAGLPRVAEQQRCRADTADQLVRVSVRSAEPAGRCGAASTSVATPPRPTTPTITSVPPVIGLHEDTREAAAECTASSAKACRTSSSVQVEPDRAPSVCAPARHVGFQHDRPGVLGAQTRQLRDDTLRPGAPGTVGGGVPERASGALRVPVGAAAASLPRSRRSSRTASGWSEHDCGERDADGGVTDRLAEVPGGRGRERRRDDRVYSVIGSDQLKAPAKPAWVIVAVVSTGPVTAPPGGTTGRSRSPVPGRHAVDRQARFDARVRGQDTRPRRRWTRWQPAGQPGPAGSPAARRRRAVRRGCWSR